MDVGLVATLVGSAAAVVAVGVGLWQGGLVVAENRRQRRAQREAAAAAAPRTIFDQGGQQVDGQINVAGNVGTIPLGPGPALPPDRPAVGAAVAAPLGRLPGKVRGREPLLRNLRSQLRKGGLVILAGPGGVGKSTVATELVRQARAGAKAEAELQAWWVSGADRSTLSAGLVSVARQLGATEPELRAISEQAPDGPDRLWRRLEQAQQGWLLVIDNADDPDLLAAPAVPAAKGEKATIPTMAEGTGWARAGRQGLVLITSRQRTPARWGAAASVQRMSNLSDHDSAQALLDLAAGAGDREQAEALGRRLGGLPLALHLAGSYLGSEFAAWPSFDAYRQALDREPTRALSIGSEGADERATVMRTGELSLDDLARHGVAQARALLRLLSC